MSWINSNVPPFEEVAKKLWDQVSKSIQAMKEVLWYISSWSNNQLNWIILSHYNKEKNKYANIETFKSFLIEQIQLYIFYVENMDSVIPQNKEAELREKQVVSFEEKYHEILYFWQKDVVACNAQQLAESVGKRAWDILH